MRFQKGLENFWRFSKKYIMHFAVLLYQDLTGTILHAFSIEMQPDVDRSPPAI